MSRWHGGADLRCCRVELPTEELIQVVVLSTKRNQVRLGTDAPEDFPVLRKQLLEVEEE